MRAHHILVAGDSGGGKTTKLREVHAKSCDHSIWVNHSGESGLSGRDLADAATVRSPREAAAADATRLNWRTDNAHRTIRAARRMADRTAGSVQVVVDEAHAVLPDSESESGPASDNPLRDLLHEDRDTPIKCVLATQDPQDLFYPPIKQVRYLVWVGEPATFHRDFLRHHNLPHEDIADLERFEYAVISFKLDGGVVARGRTDPDFG